MEKLIYQGEQGLVKHNLNQIADLSAIACQSY